MLSFSSKLHSSTAVSVINIIRCPSGPERSGSHVLVYFGTLLVIFIHTCGLFLFFIVIYVQSSSFYFTKEPKSQDALHGRSAMLRCEVSDPQGVVYTWIHNGETVNNTERRFLEKGNLKFTAIDRIQDSGNFRCVALKNSTGEEERTSDASFNIKCKHVVFILHDPKWFLVHLTVCREFNPKNHALLRTQQPCIFHNTPPFPSLAMLVKLCCFFWHEKHM